MAKPVDLVRRYDEAFNSQNAEARIACLLEDSEVTLPGGTVASGRDQVVALARTFWEALPDGRISSELEVAAGDVVVTEGTLTGTHTGSFRSPAGEVPASGKRVRFRYVSIKWVRDDGIAAEHIYFDQLEFLQQIGAMSVSHGTDGASVG